MMDTAILLTIPATTIDIIVVVIAAINAVVVVIVVVDCKVNLAVKIASVRVTWKLEGRHFVVVEAIRWMGG